MNDAALLALIAALVGVAAAFAFAVWRRRVRMHSYGNAILAQRQPERLQKNG